LVGCQIFQSFGDAPNEVKRKSITYAVGQNTHIKILLQLCLIFMKVRKKEQEDFSLRAGLNTPRKY
jgi:hypothetical protein